MIGLGASAPLHYVGLGKHLGCDCVVPEDTDVANALGAVVGQVRVTVQAQVSQPEEGLFRVSCGGGLLDFDEEDLAIAAAEAEVRSTAAQRAAEAGADEVEIVLTKELRVSTVDGRRMFVEADVIAVATGRPRIAA